MLWVMPLTRFVADALGVVTICLVAILVLLGLFCIVYSYYFRSHIRSQGFIQLNYFTGPWIIRIAFILFAIWWGFGEIVRLSLLKQEGDGIGILSRKWNGKTAVADSLALRNLQDVEGRRRISDEQQTDTISLIANQSPLEEIVESPGRSSAASGNRGSFSFRTMEKDETTSGAVVEFSLLSPSQHSTPPGSPRLLLGWQMLPPTQEVHGT
ncbi:hypothetical protein LOK49_LG02G02764 [Camellia lanceoleosa]|uniref:Uncharacterized protein n=1 Tax=Camellia lanceoleosa TaxID=1840588 RepID=A0ACC0IS77_9ERIC|nr:hypothetical protein LOK49_LG02G02764 [Camellia lanceoleosa]